jgi:hypothetical protein
MKNGSIILKPHFVQQGRGPHLDKFVFATDENGDTFHSDIGVTRDGVIIKDTEGMKKFGINGYLFMTADNGGEFYQLPASGSHLVNVQLTSICHRII